MLKKHSRTSMKKRGRGHGYMRGQIPNLRNINRLNFVTVAVLIQFIEYLQKTYFYVHI